MVIRETRVFTKQVLAAMDDAEYRLLQQFLLQRPDAGPVLEKSGGLRKLRWARRGMGKRGGWRIIYYWDAGQDVLYLLLMYGKGSQEDLTIDQVKALRKLVEAE